MSTYTEVTNFYKQSGFLAHSVYEKNAGIRIWVADLIGSLAVSTKGDVALNCKLNKSVFQ